MKTLEDMKKAIIILLLAWVCLASYCTKPRKENDNCHTAIRFSNNTSKALYIMDYPLAHYFPDPFDITNLPRGYKVNSGEQNNRKMRVHDECLEIYIKNSMGTVFVYVFDAEIIENTEWKVVKRDYLVLKRYDVSLKDLQQLDWTITYPPDERMKDIKQWPPYGE